MSWGTGATTVLDASGYLRLNSSSRCFKHDIQDLTLDTSKLNDMRIVKFKWNEQDGNASSNKLDIGLIAEEVYTLYPQIVSLDKQGLPFSVRYDQLSVILLQRIKELNIRTQDLGALVIDKLSSMGAKFENGVLSVAHLVADKLVVGELRVRAKTANPVIGSGIIRAGASRVFI